MKLLNQIISHQIWLQRTASGEVKNLLPFLEQMRAEIRKSILLMGDDSRTKTRLQATLKELNKTLQGLTTEWRDTVEADLLKLAEYEGGWNAKTLTATVDAEFVTPTGAQVMAAAEFDPLSISGKPVELSAMLNGWQTSEVQRLVTGVKMGFVQGKTAAQIIREVIGAGGLTDVSERNAATVVRTAIAHVSNKAREVTYQKNSDIIEGYEIVATLDSRTSMQCKALDGQRHELGKGPMPPFHPNCRTTTMPSISSEYDFLDAGATRASKGADGGKQVPADTTYYNFLKQQPAWFQDEALGPTRGKVFRNAGLTPEEFRKISVDGFGRTMTLEHMAEMDKRVAEYLNQ